MDAPSSSSFSTSTCGVGSSDLVVDFSIGTVGTVTVGTVGGSVVGRLPYSLKYPTNSVAAEVVDSI